MLPSAKSLMRPRARIVGRFRTMNDTKISAYSKTNSRIDKDYRIQLYLIP